MRLITEIFIEKSRNIHGDKYDYSKVEYIDSKSKVIIVCKEGHIFTQSPNLHLSGSGCRECYFNSIKSNSEEFINKSKSIHKDKYDYSLVNYKKSSTGVVIICKEHGKFNQSPSVHLSGSGCKKCMDQSYRVDFKDFLERANNIHNNKYSYDSSTFKGMRIKIKATCPVHGDFQVTPDNLLSKKRGCKKCSNNISKGETRWLDILMIDISKRNREAKIDGRNFNFDAYIEESKVIYEFYGDYWHGNPNKYKGDDLNGSIKVQFSELYRKTIEREEFLKSRGFTIISIWESDFKKQYIQL